MILHVLLGSGRQRLPVLLEIRFCVHLSAGEVSDGAQVVDGGVTASVARADGFDWQRIHAVEIVVFKPGDHARRRVDIRQLHRHFDVAGDLDVDREAALDSGMYRITFHHRVATDEKLLDHCDFLPGRQVLELAGHQIFQ